MKLSEYSKTVDPRLHISDYPNAHVQILPKVDAFDLDWARGHPGEWQYFNDPTADKTSLGPANIIGGWQAGERGELRPWLNPEFVPTTEYAQEEIANHLELTIWRLDTGFNNIGHFIDAFSRNDLILLLSPDDPTGQNGWPVDVLPDAESLALYTSERHVPADANPWLRKRVSGKDVLDFVSAGTNRDLYLNTLTEPFFYLQGQGLTVWWRELQEFRLTEQQTQRRTD